MNEYEQSLSIFTYIEKLDECLTLIDYRGENDKEKLQLKRNLSLHKLFLELKTKLYMNLAVCYLKMKFLNDSILACDHALEYDKNQIKIYFRRAKVLISVTIIKY